MQKFICAAEIYTGRGSLARLENLVRGKLMIVTDPYFMKNKTAERLAKLSKAEQVAYFDEVTPDPAVTLAARGAQAVQSFQPQTVIALGGGSAMDCAKAMVYFSRCPVKLIAVPTTSGSGSEVTDFAILTHNGVKHPLVDDKLVPNVAILDADLLDGLPKALIADTGFDVLSHALEAAVATGANAITDALAQSGFSIVLAHLEESFGGNTQVRQQVHEASCMAGIAFSQAGLGLCHALSHSLGGLYHIPHGRLNAILLPAVVEFNAQMAAEKYADLARFAGLGGASDTMAVRSLKNTLIRLRKQLGLPASLKDAGVDVGKLSADIPAICKAVLADACIATNPVPVTEKDIVNILQQVSGRG